MDFDVVRTSIINAYQTYGNSDKETFNKNMSKFYTAGKQNPSVAHMILIDQLRKEGLNQAQTNKQHLKTFKDNSKVDIEYLIPIADKTPIIERQLNRDAAELEMCLGIQKVLKANETQMTDLLSEEVKPLKENFDETYKTLYPRTYKIRKEIIENTDFSMDKVTPKHSYYEKIKLAEPEQGWKSIYPRSYENRCRLIGTDRIGKSGTVSWLKKKVWNMFFVKKHDMVKCFLRIG